MNWHDEFYETFKIEKVKYETPGRDWDEDGLASWYVEMDYPCVDEAILTKLLCILLDYRTSLELDGIFIKGNFMDIKETIFKGLLEILNLLQEEDKKKYLTADIHEAFED